MAKRNKKRGRTRSASNSFPQRTSMGQPQRQSKQDGSVAPDWARLDLTATLIEDAHLGSGSGGGGIDALVARDRDGRPVIWATHLKGVLQDAARRIRRAEAAGDLFGRGGGHRQRALLTSLYVTTASTPTSRIWRSTARTSFDNRAPRDDTLRVVEYVPKDTVFRGAVEIPTEDCDLLRRLVQEVDAVGRGRATGAGRVRLELASAEVPGRRVGRAKERLHLLLRCRDPLCITATATPDNLVPSLAYIPGRTLLGAMAAWLISEDKRDAAALLTRASLSVGDALPVSEAPRQLAEAEVLPTPLSLQHEKPTGLGGIVPWWAQPPEPSSRLDMWRVADHATGLKLKRPEPDLFVYRASGDIHWKAFRPAMRVRLRNGRPSAEQAEASLFAVEQIAERTAFLCEIRGHEKLLKKLAKALAPVLEGRRWLRVGRGGVPVEVERLAWSKAPQAPEQPPSRAYLVLTSDLLVRDEYLRWSTSMDQERFRRLPGWPADLSITRTVQDTAPVHGFNGTSRLWRLPATAVRRGSVYQVEGDGVARLYEMAARGQWLGERTHEGFGRFRVDAVDALPGVEHSAPQEAGSMPGDDPMESAAASTKDWFEAHRRLADINRKDQQGRQPPSLSQWMDLVSALERAEPRALQSRLNPATAGARSWENQHAKEILERIGAVSFSQRATHARMFVHWLRAKMRTNPRRKTA